MRVLYAWNSMAFAAASGILGGTTQGNVQETSPWLYSALETAKSSFVCVNKVVSVEQQVVAGMRYTFHVLACPVQSKELTTETCAPLHCSDKDSIPYKVDVFAPLSSENGQLLSVEKVTSEEVDETFVGAWEEGPLADSIPDFYSAISHESSYDKENTPRICATDILSVTRQLVAGWNYEFHVKGCIVSNADDAKEGCSCTGKSVNSYSISTFAQSWTNTYKVTKVVMERALLGGWKLQAITEDDKNRYIAAVDGDSNSRLHVCVVNYLSLQSQVVAGTNYRYHVEGCDVEGGAKVSNGCESCTSNIAKKYEVTIYEPLGDAKPLLKSVVDLSRVSLGMQSHRSIHQTGNNLALLGVLVSGVVVVSLVLVQKLRRSHYEKLENVQ